MPQITRGGRRKLQQRNRRGGLLPLALRPSLAHRHLRMGQTSRERGIVRAMEVSFCVRLLSEPHGAVVVQSSAFSKRGLFSPPRFPLRTAGRRRRLGRSETPPGT